MVAVNMNVLSIPFYSGTMYVYT